MKNYRFGTMFLMAVVLLFSADALAQPLDMQDMFDGFLMAAGSSGGDYSSHVGIFNKIATKMLETVGIFRHLAYVIAGFGMIGFTFGAVFNKISWKHFGNIMISLFILSVMIPIIEYVVYGENSSKQLKFGNTYASTITETGFGEDFMNTEDEERAREQMRQENERKYQEEKEAMELEWEKSYNEFYEDANKREMGDLVDDKGYLQASGPAALDAASITSGLSMPTVGNDKKTFKDIIADTANFANEARERINSAATVVASVGNMAGGIVQGVQQTKGMIQGAKTAIETAKVAAQSGDVGEAILAGINAAGAISGAASGIASTAASTGNNVFGSMASMGDSAQDLFSSSEQRDQNREIRSEGGSTSMFSAFATGAANVSNDLGNGAAELVNNTTGVATQGAASGYSITTGTVDNVQNLYRTLSGQ